MNDWARTSERAPRSDSEFERRVYRREFAETLGFGTTWFRTLEKRGTIPPGCRDPGGKRLWWPASEVRATISKLNAAAERAAAPARPTGLTRHRALAPAPTRRSGPKGHGSEE